ncbi:hypothetical protein M427DRAFT_70997 [Gonapodya prolifera JEL478]|uniref:PH domain-containing protein n=1 Tax=Gonapodya prolifera (strain JEL478) TaxID=1344416 RepID=A0A139AAK8_GONPJ|nr:hypothetical protein M427DRAFT_70997 [Gonapodya prolifera JEL478]|eukprot:KXS13892.1 hypothetical protein M427DRAFT_70997 [Gonapodya prolifera JEL478]
MLDGCQARYPTQRYLSPDQFTRQEFPITPEASTLRAPVFPTTPRRIDLSANSVDITPAMSPSTPKWTSKLPCALGASGHPAVRGALGQYEVHAATASEGRIVEELNNQSTETPPEGPVIPRVEWNTLLGKSTNNEVATDAALSDVERELQKTSGDLLTSAEMGLALCAEVKLLQTKVQDLEARVAAPEPATSSRYISSEFLQETIRAISESASTIGRIVESTTPNGPSQAKHFSSHQALSKSGRLSSVTKSREDLSSSPSRLPSSLARTFPTLPRTPVRPKPPPSSRPTSALIDPSVLASSLALDLRRTAALLAAAQAERDELKERFARTEEERERWKTKAEKESNEKRSVTTNLWEVEIHHYRLLEAHTALETRASRLTCELAAAKDEIEKMKEEAQGRIEGSDFAQDRRRSWWVVPEVETGDEASGEGVRTMKRSLSALHSRPALPLCASTSTTDLDKMSSEKLEILEIERIDSRDLKPQEDDLHEPPIDRGSAEEPTKDSCRIETSTEIPNIRSSVTPFIPPAPRTPSSSQFSFVHREQHDLTPLLKAAHEELKRLMEERESLIDEKEELKAQLETALLGAPASKNREVRLYLGQAISDSAKMESQSQPFTPETHTSASAYEGWIPRTPNTPTPQHSPSMVGSQTRPDRSARLPTPLALMLTAGHSVDFPGECQKPDTKVGSLEQGLDARYGLKTPGQGNERVILESLPVPTRTLSDELIAVAEEASRGDRTASVIRSAGDKNFMSKATNAECRVADTSLGQASVPEDADTTSHHLTPIPKLETTECSRFDRKIVESAGDTRNGDLAKIETARKVAERMGRSVSRSMGTTGPLSAFMSEQTGSLRESVDTPSQLAEGGPTLEAIKRCMIGSFLYKYDRTAKKVHLRYFTLMPMSATLYWSEHSTTDAKVVERGKHTKILSYRVSLRLTTDSSLPRRLFPARKLFAGQDGIRAVRSIVVTTPSRALEIVAETEEVHEAWVTALAFVEANARTLQLSIVYNG